MVILVSAGPGVLGSSDFWSDYLKDVDFSRGGEASFP